jgi:hypothetical protein
MLPLIPPTQLIMGGKQGEFSVDDYVPAALSLYLDIIVSLFCLAPACCIVCLVLQRLFFVSVVNDCFC